MSTNRLHLLKKRGRFLKNFAHNRKVGAVAASSIYVVANVIKRVDGPLALIVEYGPGDGVMTRELLKKLSPDGTFFAIESDRMFAKALKLIDDKRLVVIEGLVEDQLEKNRHLFKGADLVVSSIPFSFLSPTERERIVAESFRMLAPTGSLIIFHQYSILMRKYLKKYFKHVSTSFVARNVFPCFVLQAKSK